jgi:hypothetical protein
MVSLRLVLAAAVGAAAVGFAGAGAPAEAVFGNRKDYIPHRKYHELGAKAVGVLVSDAQPVLSTEGRSGPNNQLCFSQDGGSYRWVYVPTDGPAQITNLQVPTGKGTHTYPALNMASPESVKPWGIRTLFTLVEVDVNNRQGSPVNDSFVGSHFKVIEGTKEYPLKVSEAIEQVRKDYQAHCKAQEKEIEAALEQARKKAIQDRKPSGPREKEELMYVTWNTKDDTLHVRFRTKVSDGHYSFFEGGGPRPFPLPPRPNPNNPFLPPPGAQPPAPPGALAFPPPPPPRFKVKVGTAYGVEFGRAYVISKEGKVVQTQRLPAEPFQNNLNPPPVFRRPVDPVPLPPPPIN